MADIPSGIKKLIAIEEKAQELTDFLLKLCDDPKNFETKLDCSASREDLKAARKLGGSILAGLDQLYEKYRKAGEHGQRSKRDGKNQNP